MFGLVNWIVFGRWSATRSASAIEIALSERLQHAHDEDEARAMLAEHLERVVPDSIVTVTGDVGDIPDAADPILAGGEPIGAVTVRSRRPLRPGEERARHDSMLRAAPVLGTLGALAAACVTVATDPLTGLGNRRLVEDALGRMVAQAQRTGDRFAVVMFDIDRFKTVNDTYGHEAGDAVLVAVATTLVARRASVRRGGSARR